MRSLDISIIADKSCSTSRTYLTYLQAAGYRPRKIILVDFVYRDRLFERLEPWVGRRLAAAAGRAIKQHKPDLIFENVCGSLQQAVPIAIDYFSKFCFCEYGDEVTSVVARDFDDPVFTGMLRSEPCSTFLYTNGGRVPTAFLNDPRVKVLHIHPGIVPHVRGSDGLFWSLLTRGRPGASCFFMDDGIDTGQLIRTREFERPTFPGFRKVVDADVELASRALLYAYDPHLRAQLLVDVVNALPAGGFANLQASPQSAGDTGPFYWMHRHIKAQVMRGLDS